MQFWGVVRLILGVPFFVSNLTNNSDKNCFKLLSVLMFFIRYGGELVLLALIMMGFGIETMGKVNMEIMMVCFVLGLFGPMEMVLGSIIYPL